MKNTRLILTASIAAALLAFTHSSSALTVPVAQDTTTTGATGKIAAASGKSPVLPVNAKQIALVRFDLNDLAAVPASVQPGNIQSAVLRLYVVSAKFPASVTVHTVAANWQESFAGAPVLPPAYAPTPLATISADELRTKSYVEIPLTAAVINAIESGNIFGFALKTTDPKAKIVFSSKEGPATGNSAALEIVANTGVDDNGNITATSATLTGPLSVSSTFVVEGRPNNNPATPGSNLFIGKDAGVTNTTGNRNVFLGAGSGLGTTTGSSNNFFGYYVGANNTTGGDNSFFGDGAGTINSSGSFNSFFGSHTGENTGTGSNNSFIGSYAGAANTDGSFNTYLGMSAGQFHSNGDRNTFVGTAAGRSGTAGSNNLFAGYQAGAANTADGNVFMGFQAGQKNTSGKSNVFVGPNAGFNNLTGNQNTFFGIDSGVSSTASFNTFVGAGACGSTTTGLGNTAIGNIAGLNNNTGSNNTFLGGNSGGSNTTESKNTFIGDSANGAAGITNSTAIGQGSSVTISNAVVLGKNCSVGIGTSAPNSTLQVTGSLSLPVRVANNTILSGLSDTDYVVVCTGTLPSTFTLPQPGIVGRVYVVKNLSTQTATLGFAGNGSNIDSAPSLSIPVNTVVQVICNGASWYKIN